MIRYDSMHHRKKTKKNWTRTATSNVCLESIPGMRHSTPNLHDIHLCVLGKIARLDHLVCKYKKNNIMYRLFIFFECSQRLNKKRKNGIFMDFLSREKKYSQELKISHLILGHHQSQRLIPCGSPFEFIGHTSEVPLKPWTKRAIF